MSKNVRGCARAHDDFNQRIALLTVNLERLKQALPALAPGIMQGLEEILEHVSSLGAIFKPYRTATLFKVGVPGDCGGGGQFCRELSDQHEVQIEFHSEGVPKELRQEIALASFGSCRKVCRMRSNIAIGVLRSVAQRASDQIELSMRDWALA